jgi:hypothetical protein
MRAEGACIQSYYQMYSCMDDGELDGGELSCVFEGRDKFRCTRAWVSACEAHGTWLWWHLFDICFCFSDLERLVRDWVLRWQLLTEKIQYAYCCIKDQLNFCSREKIRQQKHETAVHTTVISAARLQVSLRLPLAAVPGIQIDCCHSWVGSRSRTDTT